MLTNRQESPRTVAVVVITRNRPQLVKRCLASLEKQTRRADLVVVVDSSEGNETDAVLAGFPRVRHVKVRAPLGSQPKLRNIGLSFVSQDVVAFIDDDAEADSTWVENLLKNYVSAHVGGVGGLIDEGSVVGGSQVNVGRIRLVGGAVGNFNVTANGLISVDHLQGTNMSFLREALLRIGGWDERLCGGYATFEETDVCLRLKRAGYVLLYDPTARVKHGLAPRAGGLPRQGVPSPPFAYFYGRNVTYSLLKYFSRKPWTWVVIVFGNAIGCVLRFAFGSIRRPSVKRFTARGAAAAIACTAGILAGALLALCPRRTAVLPSGLTAGQQTEDRPIGKTLDSTSGKHE